MDSKQIYKAAEHLSNVVTWEDKWVHFGTGVNVNSELIVKLINDYLKDDQLYFVHTRRNSDLKLKEVILDEIKQLLGQEEFQLWDSKMEKVIKFDEIGVLLLGKKE